MSRGAPTTPGLKCANSRIDGRSVVIECRGCDESSSLTNNTCRYGVLKTLSETVATIDRVRLHAIIETEYSDEAMEVIRLLSTLHSEIQSLKGLSAGPGRGLLSEQAKQCQASGCSFIDKTSLQELERVFLFEFQEFYPRLSQMLVDLEARASQSADCQRCLVGVLPTMQSMEKALEDLVSRLWRITFGKIVVAEGRPMLERELRSDPIRIVRALEYMFENNRRIRPGFSESWVNPHPQKDMKLMHKYEVHGSAVSLYELPHSSERFYFIEPKEYDISQMPKELMVLLDKAKQRLIETTPDKFDLTRTDQARLFAKRQGLAFIKELVLEERIDLAAVGGKPPDLVLDELAETLSKFTAGLGIMETFLIDPFVIDVYIDAPVDQNEVYLTLTGPKDPSLRHIQGKYRTNVRLTEADAKGLLSRFRYESGRPFSEAEPILECDLEDLRVRVTVIGHPLSPKGLAFAFRKHSPDPWTLLQLMYNGTLSPLAAGLISLFMDGQRTFLIGGSRGSGKSSMLGAMMLEFQQNQRVLTIEDTLELPVFQMQALGYHVQPMYVMSSLGGAGQKTAEDALKVALRLGESALVLGEVRGKAETATLYEAMRAGTAGSAVLGTIHGNSPTAIYNRVVHDMGISIESFQATNLVIIQGLVRPFGGLTQVRRTDYVSEINLTDRKDALGKPILEIVDLMKYDPLLDTIVATDALARSEMLTTIATAWGMTIDQVLEEVFVRSRIRKFVVDYVRDENRQGRDRTVLLRAGWLLRYNNAYWTEKDACFKEGRPISTLYDSWVRWFLKEVRQG